MFKALKNFVRLFRTSPELPPVRAEHLASRASGTGILGDRTLAAALMVDTLVDSKEDFEAAMLDAWHNTRPGDNWSLSSEYFVALGLVSCGHAMYWPELVDAYEKLKNRPGRFPPTDFFGPAVQLLPMDGKHHWTLSSVREFLASHKQSLEWDEQTEQFIIS